MELDSSVVQDNNEKTFYEKVDNYIDSLSENFREKSVIKQQVYNDILKCLLLPKGTSTHPYSSTFVYWAKQKFILIKIAGIDIVACAKSKKPVCVYEAFYNVITEAHVNVSHGGRVMTRLQIDLIDLRTRHDKISSDLAYCWILNCIDHFSKFSWAFPLKNKSANEVASKLHELFFLFGPPRLLHSDNGREFVSSVITELKIIFPDLRFIRGRPRHPQSQECIERANGVLCDAPSKWMSTNNSSSWSYGLLPVVYGLNTRKSTVTKATPYKIMFGQQPRSNSDFWKLVHQSGVDDEEDLPAPVEESNYDLIDDIDINTITFDALIDADVVDLVRQVSDDVSSISLINTLSTPKVSSAITTTSTNHSTIRKSATDHYLATANKKNEITSRFFKARCQ
ncbi:unnamed protein product [Rotaria sp. Silwood1]|nr:unnamed protein product [Rotaria sp. Silwood1]